MHPRPIDTRRLLDEALAGLDPGAASRRPAPDRWSIAEIVEHLALAYEGTARRRFHQVHTRHHARQIHTRR